MPEQHGNIDRMDAVRDAAFQSLGLRLTDDEIEKVIKGDPLSLDQLLEHHNPTEIGTALIRLQSLSDMLPSLPFRDSTRETTVCIGSWCWTIMPPPPGGQLS